MTHQATRNKRRGAAWESKVAAFLASHGFPLAERRRLTGVQDQGDMAAVVDRDGDEWVIEAKDCATWTPKVWCDEASKEAANRGTPWWVVVIRRRGTSDPGDAYVLCTLEQWCAEHGTAPKAVAS